MAHPQGLSLGSCLHLSVSRWFRLQSCELICGHSFSLQPHKFNGLLHWPVWSGSYTAFNRPLTITGKIHTSYYETQDSRTLYTPECSETIYN